MLNHAEHLRLFPTQMLEKQLTEKLLIIRGGYSGCGTVKGKKSGKFATSIGWKLKNSVEYL